MTEPLHPRPLQRETPVAGLKVVLSPDTRTSVERLLESLPDDVAGSLRTVPVPELPDPPTGALLLAGNVQTHPLIRELYFKSWATTDALHPGPGGYELKTLCGPFSPTDNVILVGASDKEGLEAGLQRFGEMLTERPNRLPFLFEVQASEPLVAAAGRAEALDFPEQDPASGFWADAAAAECGTHAVHTGREDLAVWFRDYLLARPLDPEGEEYLGTLALLFRLLEPLPIWSDSQRHQVIGLFRDFITGPDGIESFGPLEEPLPEESERPMEYWVGRKALSLYSIADYFDRYYDIPDSGKWLRRIESVFASSLRSSKPASDSPGHEWRTVLNIARYALARGEVSHFAEGHFRMAAKRALQSFTNQGQQVLTGALTGPGNAPWTLFALAAAYYMDATFLTPFGYWDSGSDSLLCPWLNSDEYLRSFAIDLPAELEPDLIGLAVGSLDDSYRERSHLLSPGFYREQAEAARPFDKISFRSGFRREDDYLLLDGVSGGEHSYEDANCIKEIQMRGFPWICSLDAGLRESGIAAQNGILLLRDGQRTLLPQFAELLDSHSTAGGGHVVSLLPGYSGANWTRSVFWRAAGFVLVIDEVEIQEPGRFQMEARWLCAGRPVEGPWPAYELGEAETGVARFSIGWEERVDSEIEPIDFSDELYSYYIEQNQSAYELYPTCEVPSLLHRVRLRKVFDGVPGQKASIATRFVCTRRGEILRKEYSLERDTTVIFVELPGDKVEAFPFIDEPENLSLESAIGEGGEQETLYPRRPTAAAVCPDGQSLLVGFEDGQVLSLEAESREVVFETALEGRVSCLASVMFGGRFYSYVGTEEGELACLDPEGSILWQREVEIPEDRTGEKLESRWSSHEASVRSLVARTVGDNAILAAGYGDGFLYRLDPLTGREEWEAQLHWGCASHLAIADVDADGTPEIAVGTAFPSARGSVQLFSLDGEFLAELATDYDRDWSMPSQMTALLVADLDEDGRTEVLRGAANHVEQVSLWRGTSHLWSMDCGEYPTTLAAIPGEVILVGSRSGWVFLLDLNGEILRRDYLGETVSASAPCPGGFIVGGKRGGLFRVEPGAAGAVLLRRFSSSVAWMVRVGGKLVALMESGEIYME